MKYRKYIFIAITVLFLTIIIATGNAQALIGKQYETVLEDNNINPDSVIFKTEHNENEIIGFYDLALKSKSDLGVFVLKKNFLNCYIMKDKSSYASSENSQIYTNYLKSELLIYGELIDKNIESITVIDNDIENKANIVKTADKVIWYIDNLKFISDEIKLKGININGDIIYSKNMVITDMPIAGTNSKAY